MVKQPIDSATQRRAVYPKAKHFGPGASLAMTCVLVLLSLACVVGCGAEKKVQGRLKGKVSFKGQPLTSGTIIFANRQMGVHIVAKIGPDGSYKVETADGEGLPLATYQVSITPPVPDAPIGQVPKQQGRYDNIPDKYRWPDTSGLTFTVEETKTPEDCNTFDVDMQP